MAFIEFNESMNHDKVQKWSGYQGTQLTESTLPVELILRVFPLLLMIWYLLPITKLNRYQTREGADPELFLGGGHLPNILIIFSQKPYEIKEILPAKSATAEIVVEIFFLPLHGEIWIVSGNNTTFGFSQDSLSPKNSAKAI